MSTEQVGGRDPVAYMVTCPDGCGLEPTFDTEYPEDLEEWECGICGASGDELTVTALAPADPHQGGDRE